MLLAVAALVAALIGAGGAVLLFGGEDDSPSDTSAEDRAVTAPTDRRGATGRPTPRSSATGSPTETRVQSEPTTFRCWNGGRAVARLGLACTPPFGAAGMAWVFPSSTGATCSTEAGAQRASGGRTALRSSVATAVRFHYSEWRSRADLEVYYGGNSVAASASPSGRDDLTAARSSPVTPASATRWRSTTRTRPRSGR